MQQSKPDDFTWIDLDDRAPWWRSLIVAVVVVALLAVLVAPWFITFESEDTTVVAQSRESSASYCRPETDGVPTFLNPSIASWNRFCEWFLEPNIEGDAP